MGDLPGGGGAAELNPVAFNSTSFPEPNPSEIGAENWAAADRAAREIIRKVRPTSVSEERRKEVVDYIQRLIRNCLGAEVLPYGSVPLKTYLPDGDIDLTTFGRGANIEDTLADDIKSVLEEEERNAAAELVVKDVQLIRAEVKLVKCIVQDIIVDISINQIGGLCTLCFLEQVDRYIGKDHLFKHSIIMIKAWCYYESRILGAHHGLISTYALETLVLYIFHHYHSTLHGPLTVLYKFLDYFSKFDWETYCISLNGPIRLSSLPAIVGEIPEDSARDLLLSRDFLSSCVGTFSVPSRSSDRNSRGFQLKHLNIIDPLKENNNLGRSISKGNYYRIRSAFSYGARKLARILSQPQDSIANELHRFFANTMARHGGGRRPINEYYDEYADSIGEFQSSSGKSTQDLLQGIERISNLENRECDDLTTSGLGSLKISTDSSQRQTSRPNDESPDVVYRPPLAPHLFFSKSKSQACSTRNRSPDSDNLDRSEKDYSDVDSGQGPENRNGTPESLNSSDLTGDYESYLQYLHYGRWCYEYSLGMHSLPMPPLPNTPYQTNIPWENILHMPHYKQNGVSHQHHNGFHPSSAVYAVQPLLLPSVTYGWEDMPKPRGTGTYFPNTANLPLQGSRSPAIKGRNQGSTRPPHTNGQNMIFAEPSINAQNMIFTEPSANGQNMVFMEPSSHEPLQAQVLGDRTVMVSSPDSYLPFSPRQKGHPNVNGVHIPPEVFDLENGRPQGPISSSPIPISGTQRQDRISLRSGYRLKDEDDFPPLST